MCPSGTETALKSFGAFRPSNGLKDSQLPSHLTCFHKCYNVRLIEVAVSDYVNACRGVMHVAFDSLV